MLMQEPTENMINEWKEIFNQYKNKIKPNKKEGLDIIKYLENHYSIMEIHDNELENIVEGNIKGNEFNLNKLKGEEPIIRVFELNNIEKNKELYDKQDKIFKGTKIIVGIELKTSFIFVEGSSYLYDELMAFTGLDDKDITNYFLVAEYIKCKEKFNIS